MIGRTSYVIGWLCCALWGRYTWSPSLSIIQSAHRPLSNSSVSAAHSLYLSQRHTMSTTGPPTSYSFPSDRLKRTLRNPAKQPVVLVACGSFSPVTYLHLRMFEMAVDYVRQNTDFEVVGGYLSPVSDQYKKQGLLSASHRCVSLNDSYITCLIFICYEEYECAT